MIKGFDVANPDDVYTGEDDPKHLRGAQPTPAESEAWRRPKHPSKPDLKLLDSYPIRPDLDATTDGGAYIVSKFQGNPTSVNAEHDARMDMGLIMPTEREGEDYDYEFYLPQDEETAKKLKRKYECIDEDEEPDAPSSQDGARSFRFQHHRTYDMGRQLTSVEQPYKEIALALHDPELEDPVSGSRLVKGAYYYPISMKMQLKPRRNRNLANLGSQKKAVDVEGDRPDEVNLLVRDADEEEVEKRKGHRVELLPGFGPTNGA